MAPKFLTQEFLEAEELSKLSEHPENPNVGDIGAIHQSVDASGFYGAIIAQKSTGRVLAGNHRLKALLQKGASVGPVIYVDVDDVTAKRILVGDNRTTRLGHDDDAKLAALLQDIAAQTGSIIGTGYDDDDLDALLRKLNPPDLDTSPQIGSGLQYRIIVECLGEAHQVELLDQFEKSGLKVKPVIS